jgi:hypothetical protein
MSSRAAIPNPARAWIFAIYGPIWALFAWMAVRNGELPLWLAFLGMTALLLATLPRMVSTKLTPEGVSQWTWRGRVALAWTDVRRVEYPQRGALILIGTTGVIRLSPMFFKDFEGTLAWLRERLAQVWPTETAIS